jgi:hypothetical protein
VGENVSKSTAKDPIVASIVSAASVYKITSAQGFYADVKSKVTVITAIGVSILALCCDLQDSMAEEADPDSRSFFPPGLLTVVVLLLALVACVYQLNKQRAAEKKLKVQEGRANKKIRQVVNRGNKQVIAGNKALVSSIHRASKLTLLSNQVDRLDWWGDKIGKTGRYIFLAILFVHFTSLVNRARNVLRDNPGMRLLSAAFTDEFGDGAHMVITAVVLFVLAVGIRMIGYGLAKQIQLRKEPILANLKQLTEVSEAARISGSDAQLAGVLVNSGLSDGQLDSLLACGLR